MVDQKEYNKNPRILSSLKISKLMSWLNTSKRVWKLCHNNVDTIQNSDQDSFPITSKMLFDGVALNTGSKAGVIMEGP